MRWTIRLLGVVLSILMVTAVFAASAAGEMLTVILNAGDYKITKDEDGYQRIRMEGFGSLSQPGEPWLPGRIFYIALPPRAVVHSVTVEGMTPRELPGTYLLVPIPPDFPQMQPDRDWLRNIQEKWESRRREAYSSDTPYPKEVGQFEGMGGLRKYTFARVSFCPFTYHPKSGRLIHYAGARVTINYTAPGMNDEVRRLLSDDKMDDRAAELLVNYQEARHWYPRMMPKDKQEDYDYVIITTKNLQSACDTLKDWKQDLGYDVKVVNTAWIDTAYTGADIQEKIRNFLIDKYLDADWGIEYVLIAADDDSIPMRRFFPDPNNHRVASDTTTPSDYYYADLTGNWDTDGDGFPGELNQDSTLDWVADVYVGRIASNDFDEIHDICTKLVEFEGEDAFSWKYDALLLGAMSNFTDEDTNWTWDKTDGAELMEDMIDDMLGPIWNTTTMYEKAGLDTSDSLCDQPLTHNNVRNAWSAGTYGIVNWWAHGWWNSASRKWWSEDDGDGIPESWNDEISWQVFIENADCPSLDDDHPSIVYANSCRCGWPEQNCLAKNLLDQGSAGMVASTRDSWYYDGWDDVTDGGNATLDYNFFHELLNHDKKLGEALFDAKVTHATQYLWSMGQQMNLFDFCLYGEPSLIWQGAIPAADTISTDTTWTASQSPYIVENMLYIQGTDGPDNITTLTINPGVRVVFGPTGGLTVGGSNSSEPGALAAVGTVDSMIVFTSISDTTKNEPYDWNQIKFQNYSDDNTCWLDYCLIEYPFRGVSCDSASPIIANCIIRNASQHGIALYSGSDAQITNTIVMECGQVGIRLSTGCDPMMYGDSVFACSYGMFVEYSSPWADSCFFMNNENDGIYISGNTSNPRIANCLVQDNGDNGIYAISQSTPTISDCDISHNTSCGIFIGDVDGAEIYGNTISQHNSLPGIEIQGPNDSVWVYSNTMTDNDEALVMNSSTSSSPTMAYYNTIESNDYGIVVNDSLHPSIHHNDILNNTIRNLHNGTTDTLVAEYNWWGSTDTGTIESKLGGDGEIDYLPFLTNTYHAPWVEVTAPNGGEIWAGQNNITWVAPDVDGDVVTIDIYYSSNGGVDWTTEATDEPNDSIYSWDTESVDDGNQYLIRLVADDGTDTSWDISDAVFTVYNPDPPQVTVIYPNGGETLADSVDVTWTATDADAGDSTLLSVDLEYSANAGADWSVVDSNQANNGTYRWDISELSDGNQYLIRITAMDTSGLSDVDSSDAIFEIDNPDAPQVIVQSPNGGEHWSGTHDIIWTASDADTADTLTFDLYVGIATLSDTGWTLLDSALTDTIYSWNTTGTPDWHTCYLKVVATDQTELTDEDLSNSSFVVDNSPPPMPSYLNLDAEWDFDTNLGKAYLIWEDVVDTLSPPEVFDIYYGTADDSIDYETSIMSTGVNSCTIDSLSYGTHYFGLSVRDAADEPNEVIYSLGKGLHGEGVYFTHPAAFDDSLAGLVGSSNGVVTGSSPNYQLNGSLVLTHPDYLLISNENLRVMDVHGHYAIIVYDRLVATNSTLFAFSAGDWRGIVLTDSSADYDTTTGLGCLIDSCTIRQAVNGIEAIWCSPRISNNEISYNSFAGIKCFWSGATILYNDSTAGGIHHNQYGIYVDGEGPNISGITARHNQVRNNSTAGMHYGAQAQPFIYRNRIHDNNNGVEFETWAFPAQFDRNDIWDNTTWGVLNDTTSVLVTATLNWWGDPSGPSGVGSGSGDAVSKNVTYKPFLTYPSGEDVVDWCKLISPSNISMDVGDTTQDIKGQVYEPGITPGVGQGAGITAQVGCGSNNSQPSGGNWAWFNATYSGDVGNNDEYTGNLIVSRVGTYDYAFRFSKDGGTTWVYGDLDGNNTGGGGSNGYTTDQAGDMTVGYVLDPVIVIDDDLGGWQTNYTNALNDNGIGYDEWDVSIDGSPPASVLNKYQVVVWETGEDDTSTLTPEDEDNLMAYLDNGGSLFLSSKGYLTEILVPDPFSTDYLHLDTWVNDVTGIQRELGEPGDPISEGMNLELQMPLCVGTDDMIPGVDATGIFHNDYYKSGKQPLNFGGLRYPVNASKGGYRVVFFSFPFESILDQPDPNNQSTVMNQVMTWLMTGCLPPEALMAGDKYPAYVPLTWSPPGSLVDTLLIHDGTFEGQIGCSEPGEVLAVGLTPQDYPCVLRTLMFCVADWPPMTAVDMYVFPDTSAPGAPIAGPYEVITQGHGDGWVFVDVWDDQIVIDNGDFYPGVAFRASWDTYVAADRTDPFQDRSWWGESVNGPWEPLSNFGWPLNISDLSICAVVTYEDGTSKFLGGDRSKGVDLALFGTSMEGGGGKALLGYNVYRSEVSEGPYDFLKFVPEYQTTYVDSSVAGGEDYWYVVSATYHQEETGYSNEDQGAPRSILPPEAIEDLEIALEVDDLHLSWSPVTLDTAGHPKNVDHYTIFRVTDPNAVIGSLDSLGWATETFFVDQGAAGGIGVQYFYAVKAVDCDGAKSAESNRVGEFDRLMDTGSK